MGQVNAFSLISYKNFDVKLPEIVRCKIFTVGVSISKRMKKSYKGYDQ